MSKKTCRSRDSTTLQKYIDDPALQRKIFAKALANDGFLSLFNGQVGASECVFSFNDSDWYGVYLLDQDGNKYWNKDDQRYEMFFFQLAVSPDGKDAFTRNGTTDMPSELKDKQQCAVNENGNCAMAPKKTQPKAPKEPKEPKEPKAPKAPKATKEVAEQPSVAPDVLARLQTLNLNENEQSRQSVSKEFFENMKNKMLIVQWMVEHMPHEDIVQCIKKGSFSPQDITRAESVLQTAPEPVDEIESEAVEAAAAIPSQQVKKMFKRITKQDLIEKVNTLPQDQRFDAVSRLCQGCGKQLEMRETKKGPRPYLSGRLISLDDALDRCAEIEAERIRQRLASRRLSVLRGVVQGIKSDIKGKGPAVNVLPETYIRQINAITDRAARKTAIIEFCTPFGYRWDGSTLFDPDGDEVLPEDALEDCAALKTSTTMSFGKRRHRASKKQLAVRKRFKTAAKKCKGKTNYKKCMKKFLKNRSGVKRRVKK